MQKHQRTDELMERAERAMYHQLSLRREQLDGQIGQLTSMSPIRTLERGYAIVRSRKKDIVVRSTQQVEPGERVSIRVVDGEFEAQVK
jgi:exodeoxyribonuclease VII large subunit